MKKLNRYFFLGLFDLNNTGESKESNDEESNQIQSDASEKNVIKSIKSNNESEDIFEQSLRKCENNKII